MNSIGSEPTSDDPLAGAACLLLMGLVLMAKALVSIPVALRQRREPDFPRTMPAPVLFSAYWKPWWFNFGSGIAFGVLGLIATVVSIVLAVEAL
ncbi:hypothetical protein [Catellatospora citrea]|uniref:Uncharacterized protein n=1 Tax=Catellatospora citrea TaxID=53366 RepID=A0A8J3P281_9ACTN|nr:hypothetical protein [Catellatospora citrea]RKE12321.1 hypothetical protein C8E86_7259 [Catellatospora citrea]GIG00828.1 hypothetical protein Cci01nite_59210 [Catellatospora citrea]